LRFAAALEADTLPRKSRALCDRNCEPSAANFVRLSVDSAWSYK
jgi:hypothetical protein